MSVGRGERGEGLRRTLERDLCTEHPLSEAPCTCHARDVGGGGQREID
jgi:hypothetical protein